MKYIYLALTLFGLIYSQKDIHIHINNVKNGDPDEAFISLQSFISSSPNNPDVMFLDALLDSDVEQSIKKFKKIANNYSSSRYADESVMRIGEYYYSLGSYIQASNWLIKIPKYYSNSEYLENSIKLYLNALIVSGIQDTAIYYAKVFRKRFPRKNIEGKLSEILDMDFEKSKKSNKKKSTLFSRVKESFKNNEISNEDIDEMLEPKNEVINKSKVKSNQFSLQFGAFGLYENAQKQKKYLSSLGYAVRIDTIVKSESIKLYVVKLGKFESKDEALKLGDKIKNRFNLNYIVVEKNK